MFWLTASVFVIAVAAHAFSNPLSAVLARLRHWLRSASAVEPVQVDRGWTVIPGRDDSFRDWIHSDDFKHPADPNLEPSLGSHLLLELYGCDQRQLEQETTVRAAMEAAAVASNATVITSEFHEFKPYGVSGAVIIAESHFTIHTWPEHGYAAIDLFYCSESVLIGKAVETLQNRFHPTRTRYLIVRRGLQSEVSKP